MKLFANMKASFDKDEPVVDYAPSQNYKAIVEECRKTGTKFTDSIFPPNNSSLFYRHNPAPKGNLVWTRASELHPDAKLFVGGADPSDINQGEIGNCWFVAALSIMATKKNLLQRVIPDFDDDSNKIGREFGIYRFRFYRLGRWIEVVVDDFLPRYRNRFIYLSSKQPGEYWGSLLEKAYAKINDTYENLVSGVSEDALVDFTGGITDKYDLGAPGTLVFGLANKSVADNEGEKTLSLFDVCKDAMRKPALMSATIDIQDESAREQRTDLGLILGHAYGVTGVVKLKSGDCLIELRNPWGSGEWKGPWSDGSPEWSRATDSEREEYLSKIEDGSFWMSWDEFATNYTSYSITRLVNTSAFSSDNQWFLKSFFGSWSQQTATLGGCLSKNKATFLPQNRQYYMDIPEDQTVIIGLMQEDRRHLADDGLEGNFSVGMYVFRTENNRTVRLKEFPRDLCGKYGFTNARESVLRIGLRRGRYVIIPCTFLCGKAGNYFLRVYTDTAADVGELIESKPEGSNATGRLSVRITDAALADHDPKADLFVKIRYGDQKAKTFVAKDCSAPVFNEDFLFFVENPDTPLQLTLFDKTATGRRVLAEGRSKINSAISQPEASLVMKLPIHDPENKQKIVAHVTLEFCYRVGFAPEFTRSKTEFEINGRTKVVN